MLLRSNKIIKSSPKPKIPEKKEDINDEKTIAYSWTLYAMREIMGMENIRNEIVNTLFPNIKNAKKMRTFDAFQQYDEPPFDDKAIEILDYCTTVLNRKKYVLFTASNIQRDENDSETHYQSFIADNKHKKLYIIDPAYTNNGPGIYEPEIACYIVKPFFQLHGYTTHFVKMTNPAQIDTNDVFCQTWSLYIALKILNTKWVNTDELVIHIPKSQTAKYNVLLNFYTEILRKVPILSNELNTLYRNTVEQNYAEINKWTNAETIVQMDATKLLFQMTADEMAKID